MQPRRHFTTAVFALTLASAVGHATPASADEPPHDSTPPDVSITTPKDGAVFPEGTAGLTVEVSAEDKNSGVEEVRLLVDGKEVAKRQKKPFTFESVPMTPGEHTLVAEADNWHREGAASAPVKITWAVEAKAEAKGEAKAESKPDAKPKSEPEAKDGCFASARPRSLAGSGIALMFAVFAGLMLRRRR